MSAAAAAWLVALALAHGDGPQGAQGGRDAGTQQEAPRPSLSREDQELVEDLELLEQLEQVRDLDLALALDEDDAAAPPRPPR